MSDETSNIHDGNTGWAQEPVATAGAETPKAFCQDCGKPLTPETLRTVGAGVFCEPCLAARVGVPVDATGTTVPPVPGEPHPWLAALLGAIFPVPVPATTGSMPRASPTWSSSPCWFRCPTT